MAGPALKVGSVLAGKLRVERMIGRGAMGVVLACTDMQTNRRVAVKIMNPGEPNDEARARFLREAHAAASLASEHMTRVLEVGELDDGTPFFVMELLEGTLLETVIEKDGPAPVDVAIDWMLQALDVVAEAHMRGLVHRDLKPANLFLAERPSGPPIVKVMDFGVVKNLRSGAGTRELTVTGATVGTPAYMAPEQISADGKIDQRTDVWACGVTLFELLTGKVPFESASIPAMMSRILKEPAPSLRSLRPDVPERLDAIVARCLSKDPKQRFADARELGHALAALRGAGARAGVAGDADPFAETMLDTRIPVPVRNAGVPDAAARARARQRNGILVLAGLGLLAIVLGVIAWKTGPSREPAEPLPLPVASSASAASETPRPPATPHPPEPRSSVKKPRR